MGGKVYGNSKLSHLKFSLYISVHNGEERKWTLIWPIFKIFDFITRRIFGIGFSTEDFSVIGDSKFSFFIDSYIFCELLVNFQKFMLLSLNIKVGRQSNLALRLPNSEGMILIAISLTFRPTFDKILVTIVVLIEISSTSSTKQK